MPMDRPPEPPGGPSPGGPARARRPAVKSIPHTQSPDAAEATFMADQRSADQTTTEDAATPQDPARGTALVRTDGAGGPPGEVARGSATVPGAWQAVARPDPARGTARVRPPAPTGPGGSRPALADVQTTTGVPATLIPRTPSGRTPVNEGRPGASLRSGVPPVDQATRAAAEREARARAEAAAQAARTAQTVWEVDEAGAATPIIRDDASTTDRGTGDGQTKTSTVAAPPADPVPAVIPPVVPGEHPAEVVARIPGADTRRIIPGDERTRRIPVVPGRGERTVTIPVAARLEQPPQPEAERRRLPRATGPYDLGHSPAVLLLSSLGVLLVALAYTGGREGTAGATAGYWIGQVVVFTPVVLRLLSRRMAGVAESFLLVMGLAVNQYLLKWMYSPDQFRFPDELQHWLATTIVMETGELFRPNPALPPAVHFPGLAEMGAAVASMTGLPVTGAGILVAGVAHLVFVGVLFLCVLRASNSPAVAGVACATYATALHYLFFSSMFLYQTAALPFFMLAVWATRRWREEGGRPFVLVAIGSVAMTTVSHHVTAFALIATLLLLGVTELVTDKPRRWSALAMPFIALAVVAAWILLVARDVLRYLEEPVGQVMSTVSMLMTDRADPSSVSAPVSIGQLALQATGLTGLFVLFLAVGRDMVTRRDRDSWRWAALIGGAIFFAGNGVRFLGQNGPEIAGRLSTFTYIPISIIAAIALVRAVQILPSRDCDGRRWWVAPALYVPPPTGRNLVVRVLAGSALVTLLMIGARAGGWPPVGSLLPGPYLAGGFERSVDAYGVDAAEWERDTLGPGNRVGGDVTSVSLASTYGRQDPVREVGALYYANRWSLAEDSLVRQVHVDYLVVDRRLSTQLPQSEAYFENDPRAGRITEPLTSAQITKFDSLTEVDRLYDNGMVRVYRMRAAG
jgi:hypothetical protein